MRCNGWLRLSLLLALCGVPARPQSVNTERPSEEIHAQKIPTPEDIRDRVSGAQFQKDAAELAQLCHAVSADMEGVKQGMLPKEAIDRLKRVEKLSKRVREELQR